MNLEIKKYLSGVRGAHGGRQVDGDRSVVLNVDLHVGPEPPVWRHKTKGTFRRAMRNETWTSITRGGALCQVPPSAQVATPPKPTPSHPEAARTTCFHEDTGGRRPSRHWGQKTKGPWEDKKFQLKCSLFFKTGCRRLMTPSVK